MQDPANLQVTKKAEALAVNTYRLTAGFPSRETFGLAAQMRRAAVSIGSNIAEGCGRSSDAELVKFLHYALGSAHELLFQLRIAAHLTLADADALASVVRATRELERMLTRLIVGIRRAR